MVVVDPIITHGWTNRMLLVVVMMVLRHRRSYTWRSVQQRVELLVFILPGVDNATAGFLPLLACAIMYHAEVQLLHEALLIALCRLSLLSACFC